MDKKLNPSKVSNLLRKRYEAAKQNVASLVKLEEYVESLLTSPILVSKLDPNVITKINTISKIKLPERFVENRKIRESVFDPILGDDVPLSSMCVLHKIKLSANQPTTGCHRLTKKYICRVGLGDLKIMINALLGESDKFKYIVEGEKINVLVKCNNSPMCLKNDSHIVLSSIKIPKSLGNDSEIDKKTWNDDRKWIISQIKILLKNASDHIDISKHLQLPIEETLNLQMCDYCPKKTSMSYIYNGVCMNLRCRAKPEPCKNDGCIGIYGIPKTHKLSHSNIDCETLKLSLSEDPESASIRVMSEIVKRCPTCNIPCEKITGCNHIKCISCGCHWCYVCRYIDPMDPRIPGSNIYDHFRNSKCETYDPQDRNELGFNAAF